MRRLVTIGSTNAVVHSTPPSTSVRIEPVQALFQKSFFVCGFLCRTQLICILTVVKQTRDSRVLYLGGRTDGERSSGNAHGRGGMKRNSEGGKSGQRKRRQGRRLFKKGEELEEKRRYVTKEEEEEKFLS